MKVCIQPNTTTGNITVWLADELGNQSNLSSFCGQSAFWDAYACARKLISENNTSYIIQLF